MYVQLFNFPITVYFYKLVCKSVRIVSQTQSMIYPTGDKYIFPGDHKKVNKQKYDGSGQLCQSACHILVQTTMIANLRYFQIFSPQHSSGVTWYGGMVFFGSGGGGTLLILVSLLVTGREEGMGAHMMHLSLSHLVPTRVEW